MFKTFQIKENFEAKHKNMEYITRKYERSSLHHYYKTKHCK